MEDDHYIAVTHFINPHLFWYKKIGGASDEQFHVLAQLEEKLQELYKNKALIDPRFRPAVGDKVVVKFVAWNKYIRAEVLQKAEFQQEEFVVWALDYGFPLLTKKEYLRYMPSLFASEINLIHCGGMVNIEPAEQEFDVVESDLIMIKREHWLQKACDMLEKLLADAASISFIEQFENSDNHRWGDLVITNHKGNTFNAREYLLKTTHVMEVDGGNFRKSCLNLKTIKIAPWLSNDRKTKMKFNSIKHNYMEHTHKVSDCAVSELIEEVAKRKVEDWHARNERKQIDQDDETVGEISNDNTIDDITFDDSVSVINKPQNYIGKAGAMTKIKQQKYASKNALPPAADSNAFQMDSVFLNLPDDLPWHCLEENQDKTKEAIECSAQSQQANSSVSGSTNVSARLQKLAEARAKHARTQLEEKHGSSSKYHQQQQYLPLVDINSNTASTVSSGTGVSMRLQKLTELRKKHIRAEDDKQKHLEAGCRPKETTGFNNFVTSPPTSSYALSKSTQRSNEMRQKHTQNETVNSTISHSTNMESIPYQTFEQSTSTTHTDSIMDKIHETPSELSVKSSRAKQLKALRKKIQSHSVTSSNATFLTEETHENPLAQTSLKYKENLKQIKKQNDESNDDFKFKLIPKTTSSYEKKSCETNIESDFKLPLLSTNKMDSQSAYDGLTMIPAGFDIARLNSYRDEKNHWHRKKTTRHDRVPHDQTGSSDDFLFNSHDQSSSSSDFFQMKPPKLVAQSLALPSNRLSGNSISTNKTTNILDSTVPSIVDTSVIKPLTSSLQQHDTTFNVKGMDVTFLPSEISTSSASTLPSQKLRKRRQLKSPTSQLNKIEKILLQSDFEKQLGNTNILDLKLCNTSPQKSLVDITSTDSLSDNNTASNTRVLIENRNIGSSPDNVCNEKRLKEFSNYTTLMEVKHTEHLPIVEGERKLQTKFIDHLVLAHCSIPLEPIENVIDAPFLPEIHEEMQNMRVTKVYRIQVYSWSHVLRGNSLFVVNPSRTGKTWSYLPPLCSSVCYRNGSLKPTYGPVAIILVASSRHVELVNSYCRRLMCGLREEAPTCVPSYGMRNFIETKIQLLNSCGILVCTPSSLLRLLHDNDSEPLFDAERLKHIVIDDMDLMLSRAQEDFEKALRLIFKLSKKSQYKTLVPQLIVTSRDWDGLMVRLIRKSNQPLLLIGDFLEAAVYGRASLSVKLKSSTEKNDTILKFIKKNSQSTQGLDNRMLIMCNEDEDVTNVLQFLQECGYPCLGYYTHSSDNERVTIDEWKNKVSSQILVCTDARFRELKLQNVQNLIHYSMPTSWTRFTTRFSALAQTYENFVSKNFEQPLVAATSIKAISNENSAHSMILLDEDNSLQLPRLVDFMRKHNQTIHEEILAVSKRVLITREESRIFKGALLCPQLLEFGECDETHCDNRHELTRFDVVSKNDDIPCAGEMRIHILKVFSPTYYAARILQHKPLNSTKWLEVRQSSETLKFTMQLDIHYRNENNLSLHWPPHLNDLCIYKYADNFRRARILDAPVLNQKNTNVVQSNLKVTLKLIDDGTIISAVKCNELFVCDDKFKDFPAQAIDVRLMNVVPFDNERTWDSKTTKQVHKWIVEDIKAKYIVQASINFSLANTIWVNNVVVMEKLTGIDAYSQVVHLRKSLTEKNFAMIYRGDRKHVREIAEEYNLLNVSESKLDNNDDSDLDYQSCQNDSINLMRFSSSNGDATNSSMESAKTNAQQQVPFVCNEAEEENVNLDVNTKSDDKDKKLPKETTYKDEENWDTFLDDGKEREEVFVPLRTNSCNDIEDNENKKTTPFTDAPIQSSHQPPKEETWCHLPLNELVKVEIGDEGENGNWENIFLQIIDKKSMNMFDDLKIIIDQHINSIKANKEMQQKEIYDFEPLHNCIVKYNNLYLRAKVHGVFGTNPSERLYRFFLCDYSCFANTKSCELYNDFLYETTEEIITFMPYQGIHCTLVGIQWDRFTKRYQVTKEYLYACAVLERSTEEKSSLNLYNLPIHSYKILMYECEIENDFTTAVLFNKTLLDYGITVKDEGTAHFLEYELGIEEKLKKSCKENAAAAEEEIMDVCDTNNADKVYSYEQFLELAEKYDWEDTDNIEMNDMINDIQKSLKAPPLPIDDKDKDDCVGDIESNKEMSKQKPKTSSESEIEEQGHCTSDSNSKKSSISLSSSSNNSNCSPFLLPLLKNIHKRPSTTWYENDCIIFLAIYAPDVKDYLLEIKQKTILFAAEIQGEEHVLLLNLLGSVDPQYVSHEIKGLNVVIRLVKIVFEKWPRLLEETTKYSWLKYNFNAFDSKEMEYILPEQRLHTVLKNPNFDIDDNYDDDDDSERELYQTYNPIYNYDDECDPFS